MATENRMIDAIALEHTLRVLSSQCYGSFTGEAYERVLKLVENTPAVDAVEVVRCKDCKHLIVANKEDIYAYCPKMNTCFLPFGLDTREHYCSCGERKDND